MSRVSVLTYKLYFDLAGLIFVYIWTKIYAIWCDVSKFNNPVKVLPLESRFTALETLHIQQINV